MSLAAALREFFSEYPSETTYWIAYSGGLDSHVLLSLCAELNSNNIRAIHINHQISQHANAWSTHCADVCARLQIPFVQHSIQMNLASGDSLEEVARNKRYEVFSSYIKSGDVLLTAHHQDDQAETLLIQLMRGAGPKGLSAMPEVKVFSEGLHARPLLEFSRAELLEYAVGQQLNWIEDESNKDTRLTRNFVRHAVLPLMAERMPGVLPAISRSAKHCADTQEIADEYIELLLSDVIGSKQNLLSVAKLLNLSVNKQRLVIREWISRNGYLVPNAKKLQTIVQDVLHARWDGIPLVEWGDVELRRYRDDLYLVAKDRVQNVTELPDSVRVCFRDELNQLGFTDKLKRLFQSHGVPPWERATVPVLLRDDEIVGIAGYY